ncbi:MAG TPA: hypothetical protein VFC47_01455 [Caulobacteraceae bacterium]|nr:hypothetical protein [Caulobacteraceae bacterium]
MAEVLKFEPAGPATVLALVAGLLWLPANRALMWPALTAGRLGGPVLLTTAIVVTVYSAARFVSSVLGA